MMSEMKSVVIFIPLITSLSKFSQGFEIPCNASNSTQNIVLFCPVDEKTYLESAKRKNCSAISNNCPSFEYHCLPNRQNTALIELCAPSLKIIGNVCSTYHEGFNSIRRTEIPCPTCPYSYNSINQFKYHGCYKLSTSSIGPQELSSLPPVSPGNIINKTEDTVIPNKKNVTEYGHFPGEKNNTERPYIWEYVFLAGLGIAILGRILFIILNKVWKTVSSNSDTDVEAEISDSDPKVRLLSENIEVETHRTGQRNLGTNMSQENQARSPNTTEYMNNSVSSHKTEQQTASHMSSEQPADETEVSDEKRCLTGDDNSANPAGPIKNQVEIQQRGQESLATSSPDCADKSNENQTRPPNCMDNSVSSHKWLTAQQTASPMSSDQPAGETEDSGRKNCLNGDDNSANPAGPKKNQVEIQQRGQERLATSSPDCTDMSDENQTHPPNTTDCMDNSVSSHKWLTEKQTTSPMSCKQPVGETENSDHNSVNPGNQVEIQQRGQESLATSSPDCTDMSKENQTRPPNTTDCMDNSVSPQHKWLTAQQTPPISSEQPAGEIENSDDNSANPAGSKKNQLEIQQRGQESLATSSPDCADMSDENQTRPPNTTDCMDNSVSSHKWLTEKQTTSPMSCEQPVDDTEDSCRKPCLIGAISSKARTDYETSPKAKDVFESQHPVVNLDISKKLPIIQSTVPKDSIEEQAGHSISMLENSQIVSSVDSISTQESGETEGYDKRQLNEASKIRKPHDKCFISVEDNSSKIPENMDSKKPQISINVFFSLNDNDNNSIDNDQSITNVKLSRSISREEGNQQPTPKEDDAFQQSSIYVHNQVDGNNIDIEILRNENRELKKKLSKLKSLSERETDIEKREKLMAEREGLMAKREKFMRHLEKKAIPK